MLKVYQVPSERALQALTFENYEKLFAASDFTLALMNTAILAIGSALGCMLLALLVSWVMIRRKAAGTKVLDLLIFSSFAVPAIAFGFAFMVVFLAFPNPIYGTVWIILLAYMASFLPVATRFTHAAVAQLSKELEEAATMAGAPFFSVLWRVTVPLILPSLIGGGLFIFLLAAKVPTIAMLLFTPESLVLSVWVWRFWTDGEFGLTSALSVVIMFALTTIVIAGRSWIQRGNAIEKV
jgi:iron(III) transport system permease protein